MGLGYDPRRLELYYPTGENDACQPKSIRFAGHLWTLRLLSESLAPEVALAYSVHTDWHELRHSPIGGPRRR